MEQDRNENDLYTIAVKEGILKTKHTRNEFTLCQQRLLTSDVNSFKPLSFPYKNTKGGIVQIFEIYGVWSSNTPNIYQSSG